MENLIKIQSELKAPKGQYNSFGKYKYRSAEDILEAVKPICAKYNCLLTLSDKVVNVGERYYVEATATLTTPEWKSFIVTAYAREDKDKKGMDGSQITGTASSYARKYALNGLFCIDDSKDADTNAYKEQQEAAEQQEAEEEAKRLKLIDDIRLLAASKLIAEDEICSKTKDPSITKLEDMELSRLENCLEWLRRREGNNK